MTAAIEGSHGQRDSSADHLCHREWEYIREMASRTQSCEWSPDQEAQDREMIVLMRQTLINEWLALSPRQQMIVRVVGFEERTEETAALVVCKAISTLNRGFAEARQRLMDGLWRVLRATERQEIASDSLYSEPPSVSKKDDPVSKWLIEACMERY